MSLVAHVLSKPTDLRLYLSFISKTMVSKLDTIDREYLQVFYLGRFETR